MFGLPQSRLQPRVDFPTKLEPPSLRLPLRPEKTWEALTPQRSAIRRLRVQWKAVQPELSRASAGHPASSAWAPGAPGALFTWLLDVQKLVSFCAKSL